MMMSPQHNVMHLPGPMKRLWDHAPSCKRPLSEQSTKGQRDSIWLPSKGPSPLHSAATKPWDLPLVNPVSPLCNLLHQPTSIFPTVSWLRSGFALFFSNKGVRELPWNENRLMCTLLESMDNPLSRNWVLVASTGNFRTLILSSKWAPSLSPMWHLTLLMIPDYKILDSVWSLPCVCLQFPQPDNNFSLNYWIIL